MNRMHCLFVVSIACICGCQRAPEPQADSSEPPLESKQTVSLGSFESTGQNLVVADPGYDLQTVKIPGLGAILSNCLTGTWQAYAVVKRFGSQRISEDAELLAIHKSVTNAVLLAWHKHEKGIGVDSGQAGVYDLSHFHDSSIVPKDMRWTVGRPGPAVPDDLWYSYCCEITLGARRGGAIPFGAVMNSGRGDGGYDFFISRDSTGNIVGIWLVFVDDAGRG